MSVVIPRAAIKTVATARNPKQAILDSVGVLHGVRVFRDRVLLGTYIRPEKTGGIIRPDSNIEEDVFQGKVGLILKFGTTAFKDTHDYKFHPDDIPELHTWVTYFVGSAKPITINGYPCRLVRDVELDLGVDDPNIPF